MIEIYGNPREPTSGILMTSKKDPNIDLRSYDGEFCRYFEISFWSCFDNFWTPISSWHKKWLLLPFPNQRIEEKPKYEFTIVWWIFVHILESLCGLILMVSWLQNHFLALEMILFTPYWPKNWRKAQILIYDRFTVNFQNISNIHYESWIL